MPAPASPPPERTTLLTHLRRALGWNLGGVTPSTQELAALHAAGVKDPVVQRYAAWRRSLMLVAIVPTLAVCALGVLDALDDGWHELAPLAVGLSAAWLLSGVALLYACAQGARRWTQPGTSARVLRLAWTVSFLIPVVFALLPPGLAFKAHVEPPSGAHAADKLESLMNIAFELMLASGMFLSLLPAVLSVIPGAVNGCLRIKSLMPAAQLPGWLLVCGAPLFLLFWLVILVVANQAFQSPLLVWGILLWAGGPVAYAIHARVFVQSQITDGDAARIGRVKRIVGMVSLAGIALLLVFATRSQVAGMTPLGFERADALSTRIEGLFEASDDASLEAAHQAFDRATSIAYAFDLSSYQLVIDFLAKLLLVTAVFADLVLRATLAAWRNDRSLRGHARAQGYDESAAAAVAAMGAASNAGA